MKTLCVLPFAPAARPLRPCRSAAWPVTTHAVRQPSESPAYRACRRRTGELLADNRRLEFLRALDVSVAPLSDWELGFLHGLLERARHRRYHYVMTAAERAHCDGLLQHYEADIIGRQKEAGLRAE